MARSKTAPPGSRLTETAALHERVAALERRLADGTQAAAAAAALAQVGRELAATLELAPVADRIVATVLRLFGARRALLWERDPVSGSLVCVATAGQGDPDQWRDRVLAPGLGLPGLALAEGRPMWSADLLTDRRFTLPAWMRARIEVEEYRAGIAVPLVARDEVVGVLGLGDEAGRTFADAEFRLLVAFADQAALALENARLFAETGARRREAEVLAELGGDLAASRDLGAILDRVARAAQVLSHSDAATIALPVAGADFMEMRYRVGLDPRAFEGTQIRPGQGLGGRVLATGQPARTADYLQDASLASEHTEAVRAAGVRAALAVPIRGDGRLDGLLYASRRTPRPYGDHEEAVLLRLASLAAVALRNVALLEELRTRQTRLEALLDVSRELARIQPLESLLTRIAESCGQLLAADSVGLRLREGDDLVLAVGWGESKVVPFRSRLRMGESLSGLVAATGETLVVSDPAEDPRLLPEHRERYRRVGARWWLGVPVRIGDRVAGVLSIYTRRSCGFSAEDLAILTALTAHIATALENARLFQEAQRAYDEVRRTQDQLVQSQKMEAVGRLAGGVAHDFNNLLTVIRGRGEILLSRLGPEETVRRQIALIVETAGRAASLTQQLLAFSRRQVLQLRVFDLNRAVAGMGSMLNRLIGEDVELVISLAPAPGWVKADSGQIEQVILNLAVNARDAMPRGGRLTLETAAVELDETFVARHPGLRPGPHVRLAVHDSGVGMSPDVRAHLFEPFFTTKGVGKGTGLGLATVYGIVEQSGGVITVESEPGRGTRFEILLPRAPGSEIAAEAKGAAAAPALRARGAETVLLVEDEAAVRELAREILEEAGYTVLEAASGPDALALVRRYPAQVDLLLTDVVMPQMSGRELADRIAAERTALRVLYMSGYTDDAIGHHGVLEANTALLPKPFTPDALAHKVREVLDAARPGAAAS